MKLETIEKLIQFMEQHGLTELQVREDDLEFKARRGERPVAPFIFQPAHGIVNAPGGGTPVAENGAGASAPAAPAVAAAPSEAGPAAAPEAPPAPAAPVTKSGKALKEVCSPIVGTFYRRPSPNAPAYKEVGDRVKKDDVVCIVEAMKVMNEIKGEVDGVIRKILHEDGTPVEYGQLLFFVEPDQA